MFTKSDGVLILVLMEYALEAVLRVDIIIVRVVLILVLMEYALEDGNSQVCTNSQTS